MIVALPTADEACSEAALSRVTPLPRGAASEFEVGGSDYARVPDGTYRLRFTHYETFEAFKDKRTKSGKAGKLVLWFKIAEEGEWLGTPLAKFYNADVFGESKRSGRFRVGARSNFSLDYFRLFGHIGRRDRLSFDPFRQTALIGHSHTVEQVTRTDANRQKVRVELPEALKYSVIRELEVFQP
jgi:hypothetical protein